MKLLFVILTVFSGTVIAKNLPNFNCTDIRGDTVVTDNYFLTKRVYDQMPVPYGSYRYSSENGEQELIIVDTLDRGYYYGNMYLDKDGYMNYEVRCNVKK